MSILLAPNFTLDEFEAVSSGGAVPASLIPKAREVAMLLQVIRDMIGVPLILTSYWRSVGAEVEMGHTYHSQHVTGSAVDARAPGIASDEVIAQIVAAMQAKTFPDFGQLIGYPLPDRHFHISLADRASGKKNEILYRVDVTGSGSHDYAAWDGVSTPPAWIGTPRVGAVVVAASAPTTISPTAKVGVAPAPAVDKKA